MGPTDSTTIVDFLRRPASYPDAPPSVEMIETHISWVFLTDRFAYKLKKPVQFEFVDFSTPGLRRAACQEELRLNRRLAADVYLDVLPVTRNGDGKLALAGDGEKIDWLVQMRRLPAEKALDASIRDDRLSPDDAHRVARFLTKFYIDLPAKSLADVDHRQALGEHIRANAAALHDADSTMQSRIRRIHTAELRFLDVEADVFARRIAAGRIVDGHGDLRPEHVYLESPPAVIDCLEFSAELRTVDIADELSFLAMECERLGHAEVGELVLAEYQTAAGDSVPPALLAFYRSYRACVRAKVERLRRDQQSANQPPSRAVEEYLQLADRDAQELGRPSLILVGGLMGTGKSTLAGELADRWNLQLLSTDRLRRELLGPSAAPAAYGQGNYEPDARKRVYDELFRRAGHLLSDRQSLILDGSFASRDLRQRAHELARTHGAASLFVECTCPRATAVERIRARSAAGGSDSEARADLYDRQAKDFDPALPAQPAVAVDTTQRMPGQLEPIYLALRRCLFEERT